MNIEPMSDGLVRQRRNLFSASCIIIFLKFAGVEISKLTFLGIDFGKIGNPSALYLAVWIIFGYFLFRYYQYFSQEGMGRLSRYYYEEMEKHTMKRAKELAHSIKQGANYHPHQFATLKNEGWNIRVTYNNGQDEVGGIKTEVENIKFPVNELGKYRIMSIANLSLNTSALTDYILPFIVAAVTIIYCWHGSASCLYEAIANGFA